MRPCKAVHGLSKSNSRLVNSLGFVSPHGGQNYRAHYSNASAASAPSEDVAVIGGGITGLATAFYVTKYDPRARVTIIEAGPRIGGWLQSKSIEVEGGRALFEQGPRSLRGGGGNAAVTTHLIQELGLIKDVVVTSRTAPAATNRFVYYPDYLVKMPGPGMGLFAILSSIFRNPVFEGVGGAFFRDLMTPKRSPEIEDESIESFVARRFSKAMAGNLVSAMTHGIYAGDITQLSTKSLFPFQWYLEQRLGNVIMGAISLNSRGELPIQRRDLQINQEVEKQIIDADFERSIAGSSIFSFRNGLQQLTDCLREVLAANPNVKFQTNTQVHDIKLNESSDSVLINVGEDSNSISSKNLISTISAKHLSNLCTDRQGDTKLPSLANMHSVTVMVVNLYFRSPNLLSFKGFGYLLPRTVPFLQNPERALGVIFDSEAMGGQDTAPGTKLTVMLGGHWWDGWSSYPTNEDGIEMAKSILARHLNINEEPEAAIATLQSQCIPQYTVGHEARLKTAHVHLKEAFKGRVRVAGSSYTGVSVHDCLRGALDVARHLYSDGAEIRTGLEHLTDNPWLIGKRVPIQDAGSS